MSDIILTIAIPSIPSRIRMNLEPLFSRLMTQVGSRKDVEIISLLDNKMMTNGRKRQVLHRIAQGKYCVQIDDDDNVVPNYIEEVCNAIQLHDGVDVIHYNQEATINGVPFLISTDINASRNPYNQLPVSPKDQNGNYIPCVRPPFHWCAWRTEFVKKFAFGKSMAGEDTFFVDNAVPNIKSDYKIDKILHLYNWSSGPSHTLFVPETINMPVVLSDE